MTLKLRLVLFVPALTFGLVSTAQPGTLDSSFDAGGSAFSEFQAFCVAVQPDGRILAGTQAVTTDGTVVLALFRLLIDGSVDPSFVQDTALTQMAPRHLLLRPDGKIFASYGDAIYLLQPDGAIDPSFTSDLGTVDNVSGMALGSDGKLIVIAGPCGCGFTDYNVRVARLNEDGSQDPTFITPLRSTGGHRAVAVDSAGRIVVGSWAYVEVDGELVGREIRRLLPSGEPDPTFDLGGEQLGPYITDGVMHLLPDGRILSGTTALNRILPDGSVDPGFTTQTGAAALDPWFEALVVQANGDIIVGGRFRTLNGEANSRIARLGPDGELDEEFTMGAGVGADDDTAFAECCAEVGRLALQPDGRVLVAGYFLTYDGQPVKRLIRLNTCTPEVDCEDISTSIGTSPASGLASFDIYPVPSDGSSLTLRFPEASRGSIIDIAIVDAAGRQVFRTSGKRIDYTTRAILIPASLTAGYYVVEVALAGQRVTRPLIVE